MALKTNLLATVNANIYGNGNQEITGPVLNAVLRDIVEGLLDYLTVQETGLYVVDQNSNIALKYDDAGFDVAKLSDHFKSLVSGFEEVQESGFFFVDENYNIGAKLTQAGFFAKNTITYEII